MDKRASLRQHFQQEDTKAQELEQYKQRTAQLNALESTMVQAFNALIKFMDGKTTKTEVVNQLKSISTPDVDKVVQAVLKLDKDILSNKLDLKPVTDALNGMKRELGLIPKSHPKQVEQREDVKVTNLDEIKLDTSDVVSAIKGLKLDVKAPIINEKDVDLTPLKNVMLDLLKAVNAQKPVVIPEFPKIPETDLSKVEKKLDESNKHLKAIVDKPVGGGGGGGNGSPYVDSTGKMVYVEVTPAGKIPVDTAAATYITILRANAGDPDITYVGKAIPGTATSDAAWQIARLDENTNLDLLYADSGAFTQVYDDREAISYA